MIPAGTGILCLAARLSLLPLLFFSSLAVADWTGVSFEIGNYDADWEFERDTREAQVSEISFQIEERTGSGLAVGASIGYFDLRKR
jgi:hypothetical protein